MAEESMCEVICPKCGEPLSPGVDHYVYNDPLSPRKDFDRKVCIQRCVSGHIVSTVIEDRNQSARPVFAARTSAK